MKKFMFIFSLLTLVAAGIAEAQRTPRASARQQSQQMRIREGVRSGDLTRSETHRLRTEQRHVRRTKRRMNADGKITGEERARLQHKQNRVSRDIRRQKLD
jgi:Ni/Co efflux regulator RcnB